MFIKTNKKIAVLVNREHNKFPIKADYKGISLSTSVNETVKVNLNGKKRYIFSLVKVKFLQLFQELIYCQR